MRKQRTSIWPGTGGLQGLPWYLGNSFRGSRVGGDEKGMNTSGLVLNWNDKLVERRTCPKLHCGRQLWTPPTGCDRRCQLLLFPYTILSLLFNQTLVIHIPIHQREEDRILPAAHGFLKTFRCRHTRPTPSPDPWQVVSNHMLSQERYEVRSRLHRPRVFCRFVVASRPAAEVT